MTRCNDLSEQMGVGAEDDPFAPGLAPLGDGACRACGYLHCDGGCVLTDEQKNARLDAETPEPCRGCGRRDCDSECAEFRAWLTVAWLAVDTADRASQAAYTHHGGDADARP